jgi:hypothetical protein
MHTRIKPASRFRHFETTSSATFLIGWIRQPGRYTSWSFVNAITNSDIFKLPEPSEGKKFHPALRRYLAGLTAKPDFPASQRAVMDDEFTKSVQLEIIPVFGQMLN